MADTSQANFLTTYGTWDLETFVECHPSTDTVMFVVHVDADGAHSNERIGATVLALWDSVLRIYPDAHGHRLAWRSLVFRFPKRTEATAANALAPKLVTVPDADCNVAAGLAPVPGDVAQRIRAIDDLGVGVAKIDYRGEFPNAWVIRNGAIVNDPHRRRCT